MPAPSASTYTLPPNMSQESVIRNQDALSTAWISRALDQRVDSIRVTPGSQSKRGRGATSLFCGIGMTLWVRLNTAGTRPRPIGGFRWNNASTFQWSGARSHPHSRVCNGYGSLSSPESRLHSLSRAATPNSSLKRSANGRPPGPARRNAVQFLRPGPGVLTLAPSALERWIAGSCSTSSLERPRPILDFVRRLGLRSCCMSSSARS